MPRRRGICLLIVLIALAVARCGERTRPPTPTLDPPDAAWSDEFTGPANSPPDPRKWTYDLGNNNGWGNGELQTYTSDPANVHLDGQGHLIIRAVAANDAFTSARLKTRGLMTARYGRVEARMRLPQGQGIWSAFWMLGDTFNGGNWPQCGEIDVVEHIGKSLVYSTVHGPGYSGTTGVSASRPIDNATADAEGYHVFVLTWAPQSLTFSVDGVAYHHVTPASLPPGAAWVFDQRFFLILNLAVGGRFPGMPDATTRFPQELRVDYVRYTIPPF
jgi:beta-glucanase (GH16 family)